MLPEWITEHPPCETYQLDVMKDSVIIESLHL